MCMTVIGLNSRSLGTESAVGSPYHRKDPLEGLADERLVLSVIWLKCFCFSLLLFFSEKHTVDRKLMILGLASAVSCLKYTKEEM